MADRSQRLDDLWCELEALAETYLSPAQKDEFLAHNDRLMQRWDREDGIIATWRTNMSRPGFWGWFNRFSYWYWLQLEHPAIRELLQRKD